MAKHEATRVQEPARKRHTGLIVFLALILLLAAAVAFAYFSVQREIHGSGATGEAVTVTVEQGSGPAKIAAQLKEAGLIRFPRLFRWYVGNQGAANSLQYGEFTIPKGSSYDDIIAVLTKTVAAETVRLTFPEGSSAQAIAAKMEEAGLCTAQDFLDEANSGDFSAYRFWQYVPSDTDAPNRFLKCEGYLFPDTYDFYKDDTVHNYVATFYARFDSMITDELYAEMETQGMSLNETITLASFVQEEAGNAQDAKVAAVFRNRLAAGSPYPCLESNASSYIQNDADNNYVWNWVRQYYGGSWDAIPENIRTAYDTYATPGLTPGAISNPGIAAITAALNPDADTVSGAYYFFVTDAAGNYYYGRTLAEHQANCKKAGL